MARQPPDHRRGPFDPGQPAPRRSSPAEPQPKRPASSLDWQNAAEQLLREGNRLAALELLDRVICHGRPNLRTWTMAGEALLDLGEYAQALDVSQQALAIDPHDSTAIFLCAAADYQLGNVHQAVGRFRRAAERSDQLNAWCNLATIIPGDPNSSAEEILATRAEFARRLHDHERQQAAPRSDFAALAPIRTPSSSAPLRVGYVSAYFGDANYMRPVWNLIQHHDRDRIAVHLFADSDGAADFSWFTPGPHDRLYRTQDLTNRQVATEIRAARLDLVVDLNGYSVPPRLGLWTYRLAPVTAAWFNMYATSGLPEIDYLIGDRWVAPADEEQFYCEKIARLPGSYLSFGPPTTAAPPVAPSPALADATFTFGSLVSQYKLTPQVIDVWSEILAAVPRSRLRMANRALGSMMNRQYIQTEFARRGIAADRLEFLPPAPNAQFLAYYDQVDLALDAFPYNGGTTTTEALWQGVPVLTWIGDRWAARTSRTLLANAQLNEFITADAVQYREMAVAWSKRIDELSKLRRQLRDRLLQSSLCRARDFARDFETVLFDLAVQRQR